MANDEIRIRGAKEHNLKNISVDIPRDKLVVITGVSGSGKSSLAFDTIYAEGQRRYMESLSSYARQFLGLMEKPNVELIEGLSPAISIEQKTTHRNPRSTVGTVTEIYDYLRLLYASIGTPYCPHCGKKISSQSVDQIIDAILAYPEKTKLQILAPVVKGRKGQHQDKIKQMLKAGFVRARIDDEIVELDSEINLDKNKKHNIEIVVDRIILKDGIRGRLADSLETALSLTDGLILILFNKEEKFFSTKLACVSCDFTMQELSNRMFSFNNPFGACEECNGLGSVMSFDADLVIGDPEKSLYEGVVLAWGKKIGQIYSEQIEALADNLNFDPALPWKDLPDNVKDIILYGSKGQTFNYEIERKDAKISFNKEFEGVLPNLKRRYHETHSEYIRVWMEGFMRVQTCPACCGKRLKPASLNVKVAKKGIAEITSLSIQDAFTFFEHLKLTAEQFSIADQVLKEIRTRLKFLNDVGVGYLTLDRAAGTLSGGEAQRIRLATQIGSSLMGILYILDEPSIGLHQRDNQMLITALKRMRDLGNTVIVVEHDDETMMQADYLIDIGPGAGTHGGKVIAAGTPGEVMANNKSLTGQYLSGKKKINVPKKRRQFEHCLEIIGAQENNLHNLNVQFPLGVFSCVTGVSGSGKSTLTIDILYKALSNLIMHSKVRPGKFKKINGLEFIDKVIDIDQSPLGRTPRSNPATYTGVFTPIRELFTNLPESKIRGYKPARFSFNVAGGRCESCEGDGIKKIEMNFLPDVYVTCDVCKGRRYNRETLEVKYKGKNIYQVLDMTIDEAADFFVNIPKLTKKFEILKDVGLGYIKLGQPSTTLSGGEAQRIKLATELSKRSTGKTVYILDEPTTGLHFDDVQKLLNVLNSLVNAGNTIIVIEHNLDVIKSADWIIDLGPDGGHNGGKLLATGTPENVALIKESYTGQYLKKVLSEK